MMLREWAHRYAAQGTAALFVLTGASCGVHRNALGPDDDPAADSDGGEPRAGGATRLDPRSPDGGSSSAGGDGGSGDKSGPRNCGLYQIPVTDQTPEVLVVLDKSGSMRGNGIDRWGPSVAAVDGVTHALPNVHFGLLTFPGDCSSLATSDEQFACSARLVAESPGLSCEPGRVTVPMGGSNADAIRAALNAASPLGATPTASAIDTAATTLEQLPVTPDSGSRSILLVTDGAPNCALGAGGLLAVGVGPSSAQPEAVTQTVDAIARAAKNGVRTHVIGYDSQSDPYLVSTLDQMASAGGTGETKHRPVEDRASLVAVLNGLTRRTLLCELRLNAATDASLISITFDGKAIPQDAANGWVLAADGVSLSLRGSACDQVEGAPDKVGLVNVACPTPPPVADAGGPIVTSDGGTADAGSSAVYY
jgi:hypothetical protein